MEIFNSSNYELSWYSFPFLPVGLGVFLVGLFVLLRKGRSITHTTFFMTTLAVSVWLVGNGIGFSIIDPAVALFWHKVYWAGVIFIAPSAYSFVVSIIELKKRNNHIFWAFLIFLPFLLSLSTDFLVKEVQEYYWGFDVVGGWLELPFLLLFGIFMILAFWHQIVVLRDKKLARTKRKQIKLLLVAQVVAMFGVLDFLPFLGVSYYPIGFIPVTAWLLLVAYAIVKFELFDITSSIAAKTILETLGDILLVVNKQGRISITNDVTAKYLGVTQGYIKGKMINEFIPMSGKLIKKLSSRESKKVFLAEDEETVITCGSRSIPISLTASVIRDTLNLPVGVVFICHDVSKFKEAERAREVALKTANKKSRELGVKVDELEKLKKSMMNVLEDLNIEKKKLSRARAKDAAVLLAIGDGLIVTDRKGRIVMVNKAFEEMLGWKAGEVTGKLLTEVIVIKNETGNEIPVRKRLSPALFYKGKKPDSRRTSYFSTDETFYYVRKDKTSFPVIITATPIILDNNVIGEVQTFRDVTREKEIDKAKTEFVSLASHQLRTPLSTISWYVEVLLKGRKGELNKAQKEYLEEVYVGNQRMVDLVGALLNVSRIELGTFSIDTKPTDITKISDSVIQELVPKIQEKKLKVERIYAKSLPDIQADQNLLQIVLQNLISNSVKYTPAGGKVTIEIKLKDKDIIIKVADTGCGIPENQYDMIFTKLFRADNVKKTETTGTGLGLYIVKSILDKSGGKIWFTSKETKGTSFYVSIPKSGMKAKSGTRQLLSISK
ncbi:PAS domain-containing protein [Candidatus Dojkabacteria bacterium]|nr:PAS domain-containing protein [Candidatus Dojkabacteria bacterium]